MLSKITRLSLIFFLICVSGVYNGLNEDLSVYAQTAVPTVKIPQDQSFLKQIKLFFNSISKASKDKCLKTFGRYGDTIAGEISLDKLYFASYKEVEKLLNQAANESIDSLTLFTHPILQEPMGFAIVFDEALLQRINENFDFHGLFNVVAPCVSECSTVSMKFFITGQGKFIVGYNRNAKIKHPDYHFATGNYGYKELFIMDAKKDSNGNPGLFNIKGVSNPNEKMRWMKGPLNVDIHSMIMTSEPDGRQQILIEYSLFGKHHKLIDPIPIEKLCK